jgi:hypothetical protein
MTSNTGLLTARCDPYGAESSLLLLGGMYGQEHLGKVMWHCDVRAAGRYVYQCTGGRYGYRQTPGQGVVNPHECPGGHRGRVMALCRTCARNLAIGPPKPGYMRDQRTPVGQIGGTVANEMCPRCMWPGEAAQLHHLIEQAHGQISVPSMANTQRAELARKIEGMRARMDELHLTGVIHKCPLRLTEVS